MKELYVLLLQKENSYKIADMTNSNTTISGFEIDNSFVIVYLSNIPPDYYIQNNYFPKVLLIDSKKEIIGKWLDKEPPTKGKLLESVKEMYEMKKLLSPKTVLFGCCI